jgi:hypothetical protein
MQSRRFPKPWSVEPIPRGYRVLDANGIVLAHVYGQPDGAIADSDTRLTNDEARRISKLLARLRDLVELEKDRNQARSRRKPKPLRFKPLTLASDPRGQAPGSPIAAHAGGNSLPPLGFNSALSTRQRPPVRRLSETEHLLCLRCFG